MMHSDAWRCIDCKPLAHGKRSRLQSIRIVSICFYAVFVREHRRSDALIGYVNRALATGIKGVLFRSFCSLSSSFFKLFENTTRNDR